MKILKNAGKFEVLTKPENVIKDITTAARTCYQSQDKSTPESDKKLVENLMKREHFAMFEFSHMNVRFSDVCRGFTHEMVRHRLASFAQESTRYNCYLKTKIPLGFKKIDSKKRHKNCKLTVEEEKWCCEKYKEGYSLSELSNAVKIDDTSVYRLLKYYNVELRKNDAFSKGINDDYFKNIDSNEKAYLIGFIAADGSLRNQIIIYQARESFNILSYFLREINPNGNLCFSESHNEKSQDMFSLFIGSKNNINYLNKLGIPNGKKSKTLNIQNILNNIDEKYWSYFFRGLFDGDGHVSANGTKICLSGNEQTCKIFKNIVQKKVGIQNNVKIYKDENKNCKIYYSSLSDTKLILNWLYSEPLPLFFAKKMFRASKNCSKVLNVLKDSVYLYAKEFGFIIDDRFINEHSLNDYLFSMYWSQRNYKTLSEAGWKPEDARQVLPIATRSQIVVGANIREWRHIFHMRCDHFAHWEIRAVMLNLLRWCQENIPLVFDDFKFFTTKDGKEYARRIIPARKIANMIEENEDIKEIIDNLTVNNQLKMFKHLQSIHWR